MENIVIYVGVFELSEALNELKYLGKVGDEHLQVKILYNNGIHMQIILKFIKNAESLFCKNSKKQQFSKHHSYFGL